MIRVKIVGACGFGGVGAIEILSRHPEAELVALIDITDVGRQISELYPHLTNLCDLPIIKAEEDDVEADVVLVATPDRVGMRIAPGYIDAGYKVVDYSGDFRFDSADTYREYASRIDLETEHLAAGLLEQSTYGLAELHRKKIAKASIVGNPGCFAVGAILGAAPAVSAGIVDMDTLIFDSKTGVSGAGKKPSAIFHYPHRYEEMNAYRIGRHQHVMEIERELGLLAGRAINVTFTPQVVPVVRGIMTTAYAKIAEGVSYEDLIGAYRSFYENEPFVRVYDENSLVGNRHIRGTNNAALWVNMDRRTGRMIVLSHIDNLLKGQAGSAIQNMNILFGLDESAGLRTPGMYP